MTKKLRAAVGGTKYRMSLGLQNASVINCADNTGAKNLYIFSVFGWGARLNRVPGACPGDMCLGTVKKGKPDLRKKRAPPSFPASHACLTGSKLTQYCFVISACFSRIAVGTGDSEG